MFDLQGTYRLDYIPPLANEGSPLLFLRNGPTIQGVNYLLDVAFRGRAQPTQWYAGLVSGSGYSGVSEDDTMVSHSGWNEFTNGGGSRRPWTGLASPSGGVVGTTTLFTLGAVGNIRGMFLTSEPTGTTGLLYSTAIDVNGGLDVAPAGTYPGGIGYPPQVGGRISVTYNLRLRPRS